VKRLALALALAAAPALAAAQPSPRWGSFELSIGGYRPDIDGEFTGGQRPFQTAFGTSRRVAFRADVAYSLLVNYGSLDLGFGAGYWAAKGNGLLPDGTVSADETALKIVPGRVTLTYRFDLLAERWGVPLVPYGRVALDGYYWWVTNGSNSTTTFNGKGGSGLTTGFSVSGGLAFLLDFVDSGLAREMDRDTGINHTYLFVDVQKDWIDGFGSNKSWKLSNAGTVFLSGGLLFVF
jgi:hypothetical protein